MRNEPSHEQNSFLHICKKQTSALLLLRLISVIIACCLDMYRKVPKFLDARKLCCNLPKMQTKSPNLRVFSQEDANGIANSEDPDQIVPLGAV